MDIIKNLLGEYMFCLLDTRAVIEILQITVDVCWLFNLKRFPFYNLDLEMVYRQILGSKLSIIVDLNVHYKSINTLNVVKLVITILLSNNSDWRYKWKIMFDNVFSNMLNLYENF